MVHSQGTNARARTSGRDKVVNNNININKISINNFYNRPDAPQELYSVRSRPGNPEQNSHELRVKTDPSGGVDSHKKNFSLNEHNLRGEHFAQLKK